LTKELKELYNENYKILMKEIKDDNVHRVKELMLLIHTTQSNV
jgi:hypothetical protein